MRLNAEQRAQLATPDLVFPSHGQPYFTDDALLEQIAAHHQHKMRVLQWSIGGPIVIAAVAILLLWWTAKPAHAEAARPFYCTTLEKLPRTCASAQVLKKTFGAARAERMARKCGATDAQIAEAKACE